MNPAGDADRELLVRARSALLDALVALDAHLDSVVVVGAQAVYLRTGGAPVAVAEATKDSDLGIDLRSLGADPLIEEAMAAAGFDFDPLSQQPGAWLSPTGVPVDLMVPDRLAGKGRRGVEAPPHDRRSLRRAVGLEAAVVDNSHLTIEALDPSDHRSIDVRVAGPAALLVAKLHKLGERRDAPDRLSDKDAHDIYRLLVAVPTVTLADALVRLRSDELAGDVTASALAYLADMFADMASIGSSMAGRAESLVGDPDVVAAASSALAGDLLMLLRR